MEFKDEQEAIDHAQKLANSLKGTWYVCNSLSRGTWFCTSFLHNVTPQDTIVYSKIPAHDGIAEYQPPPLLSTRTTLKKVQE